jgi:hypothetical protein
MTEKDERGCKNLILLVGSNTLPNYIAARILKPKQSILLLYTGKTIEPKDRLKAVLKDVMPSVEICQRCILKDGTVANEVMNSCLNLPPDSHLHYSGGTKVMAAHARMALREQNQDGSDNVKASYLDERAGVLLYDDGYRIELASQNLGLTLDLILRLHGIEGKPSKSTKGRPTPGDVHQIAERTLADRSSDSTDRPHDGKWLENLIGEIIRNVIESEDVKGEVSVDIDCYMPNGRNFQIDVAVIRGHRLYVISCTTHTKSRRCKIKLFEVAMRAKQLGGDLARSGLCCLLHGGDDNGDYVDQLRFDVNSMWGASNEPCVFGLDNLREWFGIKTNANTNALSKWLHLKGEGSCPY